MIVYLTLHARFHMFESLASRAIEISGFRRVLTSIRIISYEERQRVNKKNVSRVVVC